MSCGQAPCLSGQCTELICGICCREFRKRQKQRTALKRDRSRSYGDTRTQQQASRFLGCLGLSGLRCFAGLLKPALVLLGAGRDGPDMRTLQGQNYLASHEPGRGNCHQAPPVVDPAQQERRDGKLECCGKSILVICSASAGQRAHAVERCNIPAAGMDTCPIISLGSGQSWY